MGKKMTETTTLRGALIMPYPSALGPADEPLTIEWPEGHSYAVVATAFHGGAVLGTMATEDEAWEIYEQIELEKSNGIKLQPIQRGDIP